MSPGFFPSSVALPGAAEEHGVIERPPPGPARGAIPVPALFVVLVVSLMIVAVVAHFVIQARRR